MDDPSGTTATLDQADEDILTYTVSDEALEAAAITLDYAVTVTYTHPCYNTIMGCCP
jgi:hypothetical protein